MRTIILLLLALCLSLVAGCADAYTKITPAESGVTSTSQEFNLSMSRAVPHCDVMEAVPDTLENRERLGVKPDEPRWRIQWSPAKP